jgi:Flp pilus assembly protein TadG
MLRKIKPARRSRCRGAEIIEVTFVLVPLLGLTFLLLNLSMAICLRSTFQHAVREGVRYAITGQNTPGPCQDDSIKSFVKSNAIGFLSSTAASSTMHVHWINPSSGAVASAPNPNQGGNIVEVSVEAYQFSPWAPYAWIASPVTMWARAYDVMQTLPSYPCITKLE